MKKEVGYDSFMNIERKKMLYKKPLLKEYGNVNDATKGGTVSGFTDNQNYFTAPNS